MRRKQTKVFEYNADTGNMVYLTPRWITDVLGPFDLDPCASEPRPWDIAKVNMVGKHNGGLCGLEAPWKGFVWLNPPYGKAVGENKFMEKLASHGNGVALVNVKTQTQLWQTVIFPSYTAILFLSRRVSFLTTDGAPTNGTFGNQCLIAFGEKAAKRLQRLSAHGHYLRNNNHDN